MLLCENIISDCQNLAAVYSTSKVDNNLKCEGRFINTNMKTNILRKKAKNKQLYFLNCTAIRQWLSSQKGLPSNAGDTLTICNVSHRLYSVHTYYLCYYKNIFKHIPENRLFYKVKVAVSNSGRGGDQVQVMQNSNITKHVHALTTAFMHSYFHSKMSGNTSY